MAAEGERTGTELWQLGAVEIARAIAAGETSSREVVGSHLARIEAVNPKVNALRVVLAERALADAEAADRRLAAGEDVGPLHGVPVSIKENVDVAETATTWGLPALAEAVAPLDAPLVTHLREAGAIPLSRGNLPDFALRWHTDNDLAGATVNPHDPARTPGGSSGGEAVALATGMAPLAIGNDLGGSLRWPSQCNGTVALRPTQGRVPDASMVPPTEPALAIQLFNVQGPMARRVEDLRLALGVISAPSPRDPLHVPAPLVGPAIEGPVRVALAIPEETEPEVAAGVRRAAEALSAAGYEVEEAMPPELDRVAEVWSLLLIEDVRRGWPMMEQLASEGTKRFASYVLADSEADPDAWAMGWPARRALAREWSLHQHERPLILAPVFLRMPFGVGEDIESAASALGVRDAMRMVVTANLLGLPAAALPVGSSPDGFPLGAQLIGPRFREDLCLDAAATIEAAIGANAPVDPLGA